VLIIARRSAAIAKVSRISNPIWPSATFTIATSRRLARRSRRRVSERKWRKFHLSAAAASCRPTTRGNSSVLKESCRLLRRYNTRRGLKSAKRVEIVRNSLLPSPWIRFACKSLPAVYDMRPVLPLARRRFLSVDFIIERFLRGGIFAGNYRRATTD